MAKLTKNQFYDIVAKEAENQKENPKNSCNITLVNLFEAIKKKTGKDYKISK